MQSDREIISNCNLKEGHEHPNPSQAAGTRYPHELVSNIFDSSSMRNYACVQLPREGEKCRGPAKFCDPTSMKRESFLRQVVENRGCMSTWSGRGYLREVESDGLLALVWWTSSPCQPVSCLCMSPQVQLCWE